MAARIRFAGAWSGFLEVDLEAWTVPILRAEVARRAGSSAESINLISSGRLLKDDWPGQPTLLQAGIKDKAKVLVTVSSPDSGKAVAAEEEHSKKLARLWEAAKALAQRHSDGSFPLEDYNIELEDQSGEKVMFGSEADRRAVMMGLMLHQNAKNLISKENYKEALDVLTMAEESFSLCSPKFIEMIDNVPMLQLDTVWCYFMLRDVSRLSIAGIRLENARKGFERSHGKDSARFRSLQVGHNADLSVYLRLELLEGVVAYHSGNFEVSRRSLSSAQARLMKLQVQDEALSVLMDMGYRDKAAKRALRMMGQDVQLAVDFLVEEHARKARRIEENSRRQNDIMEQKTFGRTPKNKAVDMQKLKDLISIGYGKHLAAEALRIKENNAEEALDVLTDPEQNCVLQSVILSRKNQPTSSHTAGGPSYSVGTSLESDNNPAPHGQGDTPLAQGQGEDGLEADSVEGRDAAMEVELANKLKDDPLADYDIDVVKEGEAIAEYLSLLDCVSTPSN